MDSPFIIVVFGATGDLARTKLFPSLFELYKNGQIGKQFYIVGFARRALTDNEYREFIRTELGVGESEAWNAFAQNLYYQQGLFDEEKGYKDLIGTLNEFDKKVGACITRLFYLATPPDNYSSILNYLQSTKLSEGCGQGSSQWTRVAIEKPFGKDLITAQALDKRLGEIFQEQHIFRVDHYLGKETVQNMIAFRFANGIFEPMWNSKHIDHVQITFAEKKGLSQRGNFFDGVGILRDVAQNHLMQLIATVVMEQPKSFAKEAVRDARAAAIKAIRKINSEDVDKMVVRGQYQGYQNEKNVEPTSDTETFVAMKFFVDTPRFNGVPFYVRAGKKMPKDTVEISIVFTQTCHTLFKEYGCPEIGNVLTIRIQPNEGIELRVIAKKPGNTLSLGTVDMKFTYAHEFGSSGIGAYEKVLLDILLGDQMLFNRSDELASSWEFITGILDGWASAKQNPESKIQNYEEETWGPKEANLLIEKDGRKWI